MKRIIALTLLLFGGTAFGQGLNYSPSRKMIRFDLGGTVFSDIDGKIGLYAAAAYEYAFLEHIAAEAYLNTSVYHPNSYVGNHASRMGIGLNVIGRLWGIKNNYDVKFIGGARYGSHFYTSLRENGGVVVADEGEVRSGVYPVVGIGYEQRLHDWVISADLRSSFESNLQTYTSLSIGVGYRF